MTKAELTERIINRITDPWTESCEDYEYAGLIDLDCAKVSLEQYHADDRDEAWDDEDRMPDEVTPELFMEIYNCLVRKNKRELQIKRLAEFLTDAEAVCTHNNYRQYYEDKSPEVVPTDFLNDPEGFYFEDFEPLSPIDYRTIFYNSRDSFDPDDEYCWYDKDAKKLWSSNTPFADGIIDAEALAAYAIDDPDHACLEDILSWMPPESVQYIFGCTEDELREKLNAKGE